MLRFARVSHRRTSSPLATCHVALLALVGLVAWSALAAPVAGANYGQQIIAPTEPDEHLSRALEDLAETLEQMLGEATARLEGEEATDALSDEAPAIIVAQADEPHVPEALRERVADGGRETYALVSEEGREQGARLWIVANHTKGLSHGIYDYLERLGVRWYFPSPNWRIVPERDDVTVDVDEVFEPAFITRDFFGTGGFGPRNPLDPELEMRQRWDRWKQRNRFGEQLITYGHVGHGFSLRYEDELRENPEYRAVVDGERVEYARGIKLCVSNDELLALFVEDRLREMGERIERDPDALRSHFVGVGPADGGGFCECDDCAAIGEGTVSDQMFHVANTVARAVAEEFPGRGVSMYAYAQYADLPSIDIEPNVHVWIIPYAFQRTGMTGDDLLRAWGERIEREGLDAIAPLAMYTYWSITDWGRNLPDFDFRRTPRERLRFWHDQGVQAIKFESTYSAGAMGLGHYVAVRLMWDPERDADAIIEEFYERAFGRAAAPMRRMLERWAEHFLLTRHELALAFRDMQEAYELAQSEPEAIQRRVEDYIKYVQYVRQWHAFDTADEATRDERARDLAELLWRIYPSAMVQSYRLWRLIGYRFAPDSGVRDYFDPTDAEASEWQDVAPPAAGEMDDWLDAGVRDFEPMDFEQRRFEGELVPIDDEVQPTGELVREGRPYRSIYSTTFHFHVPPEMSAMPVEFFVRDWQPTQEVRVTAFDPEEGRVFDRAFSVAEEAGEWHRIEVPTERSGLYRLEVFDQRNGFRLRPPEGVPMALEPFIPHGLSPRVYFYVPQGLETLALYNRPRRGSPASLFDAEGNEIVLEQDGPLVVVEVPTGHDGRVWSMQRPGASQRVRLLNAPEYFGLSPETLLIPDDAR